MGITVPNLLVTRYTTQEHKNAIIPPPSFITSLVHACVLTFSLAEGVVHIALCREVWLAFIASCKADATDVELTLLTCAENKPN